jgi:hypothetical protein
MLSLSLGGIIPTDKGPIIFLHQETGDLEGHTATGTGVSVSGIKTPSRKTPHIRRTVSFNIVRTKGTDICANATMNARLPMNLRLPKTGVAQLHADSVSRTGGGTHSASIAIFGPKYRPH